MLLLITGVPLSALNVPPVVSIVGSEVPAEQSAPALYSTLVDKLSEVFKSSSSKDKSTAPVPSVFSAAELMELEEVARVKEMSSKVAVSPASAC